MVLESEGVGMTPARERDIELAIADLEFHGHRLSNRLIYERVRGSYRELSQYLKTRRQQPEPGTAVAVVEEEPAPQAVQEPPSPPVPQRPTVAGALATYQQRYAQLAPV